MKTKYLKPLRENAEIIKDEERGCATVRRLKRPGNQVQPEPRLGPVPEKEKLLRGT